MTSSAQLAQIIRQFMDVTMHRSWRERSRFARSSGLSMPQFGILMHLHSCSNCGISDIGEHFDITTPAASQLVDKLVQGGLIERVEDPTDRRVRQITLSPKGKAIIERGLSDRYRWVEGLVTRLDAKEREKVTDGLMLLAEAAQKLDQTQ